MSNNAPDYSGPNFDVPMCIFGGGTADNVTIVRANLLGQPGIWACLPHARTDGWQNWPHTKAPFDLGYPSVPTIA